MFRGSSECELLQSIMQVLGRPPATLVRQSAKLFDYFEEVNGLLVPKAPGVPYSSCLHGVQALKQYPLLLDLVEVCLAWTPSGRAEARQILRHPFFSSVQMTVRLPTLQSRQLKTRKTIR